MKSIYRWHHFSQFGIQFLVVFSLADDHLVERRQAVVRVSHHVPLEHLQISISASESEQQKTFTLYLQLFDFLFEFLHVGSHVIQGRLWLVHTGHTDRQTGHVSPASAKDLPFLRWRDSRLGQFQQ